MDPLFDHRYVYPSDDVGPYVELKGTVIAVGDHLGDACSVKVETDKGTFTGYWNHPTTSPKVGYNASIRIYDAGGGWYPDNRITGWGPSDWVQLQESKAP